MGRILRPQFPQTPDIDTAGFSQEEPTLTAEQQAVLQACAIADSIARNETGAAAVLSDFLGEKTQEKLCFTEGKLCFKEGAEARDILEALLPLLSTKQLHLFVCDCIEHVVPIFEEKFPDDTNIRDEVAIRRKWLNGEASREQLRAIQGKSFQSLMNVRGIGLDMNGPRNVGEALFFSYPHEKDALSSATHASQMTVWAIHFRTTSATYQIKKPQWLPQRIFSENAYSTAESIAERMEKAEIIFQLKIALTRLLHTDCGDINLAQLETTLPARYARPDSFVAQITGEFRTFMRRLLA